MPTKRRGSSGQRSRPLARVTARAVRARRRTAIKLSEPVVLLASPDAEARKRWRRGLQAMFTTHEAADQAALTRSISEDPPGVLILDLGLPGLNGSIGIATISRSSPATKIIAMTDSPTERDGVIALIAGANGYCGTDISSSLLKKAARVVHRGEIWVGRKLTRHLLDELALLTAPIKKTHPRLQALTSREGEIVELVVGGVRNKEIARRLNIGERTVKTHLTAVFRKLGVSGRIRLALLARGTDVAPR